MHVFILILTIIGQPEHMAGICQEYQKCSDAGQAIEKEYEKQGGNAKDFSYRILPALIVPDDGKGTST